MFVGCGSTEQSTATGAVVTTAVGARTPSNEIEQVYYLGVFDPLEQLPPTIYRVTVHGQAGAISSMKFGSGWVPAPFVDSLTTNLSFAKDSGRASIESGEDKHMANIKPGRRLVMFGPEGFREAPKDHRLVIVMGASPEAFFSAMDQSFGVIAKAEQEQRNSEVSRLLFEAYRRLTEERDRMDKINRELAVEFPAKKEAS